MNIIIAGLVSVIMLLVGGTKYYDHYIRPAREQERNQEQYRQGQTFLRTLDHGSEDDDGAFTYAIKTEEELTNLVTLCPRYLGQCQIYLSRNLEEERARQILREHGYKHREINVIANDFIREIEDEI
jgi:hypothetical protein